MSAPVVSVIMPTRNRAALLQRAIASVTAQTLSDWELIVIDDGSTDETPDLLARCAASDERLITLRSATSRGAATARNQGIAAARAELIAFIDDDDEWLERKLEVQVAALGAAGSAVGVAHGSFIEVCAGGGERSAGQYCPIDGRALDDLLRGNQLGHSTVVARTTVIRDAGGFDERLPRLQDWDLWLRLAAVTRFICVPQPLVRVNLTPGSISTQADALNMACDILASKYEHHPALDRARYAELCYALGQLLLRHGSLRHGRRYVRRALRLYPWPPRRIAGCLLSQLGPQVYHGAATLHARAAGGRSGDSRRSSC